MCGFAGVIAGSGRAGNVDLEASVRPMLDVVRHRGPDDTGLWVDRDRGIALGHVRLSIIDLSAAGHQPMMSSSGRYRIVYNGEIYNHQDLRKELESRTDVVWRGHSDTEVMLQAIETYGHEAALERFLGMFAYALWDSRLQKLVLVRDRIGEKPLVYGWINDNFVFASELRSLEQFPGFSNRISMDALSIYVKHNYIPAPRAMYEGVYKLPAGCCMEVGVDDVRGRSHVFPEPLPAGARGRARTIQPRRYWDVRRLYERERGAGPGATPDEHMDQIDALARDSVSRRMVSDVPLGSFLSGGVDSSYVTAVMQKLSDRKIRTFSIGYREEASNEAEFAKRVARHIGTNHTELYVGEQELEDVVLRFTEIMDEPSSDTAAIPTFLVARLARNEVTVCLTGDGGDELFGGYPRYTAYHGYWQRCTEKYGWLPASLRKVAARTLGAVGKSGSGLLDDIRRGIGFINPEQAYESIFVWDEPGEVLRGDADPDCLITDPSGWLGFGDLVQRLTFLDFQSRLPDSVLAKVDRATMRASLEARSPLLDHRLVELSIGLPTDLKIRNGENKWILRELLSRYVPRELTDRPKKGFSVPLNEWLKGPLRTWAGDLLSRESLRRTDVFDAELLAGIWRRYLQGEDGWHYKLWVVLVYQSWALGRHRFAL